MRVANPPPRTAATDLHTPLEGHQAGTARVAFSYKYNFNNFANV